MTGQQALKIVDRAMRAGMSREDVASRLCVSIWAFRAWESVKRVNRATEAQLVRLREELKGVGR